MATTGTNDDKLLKMVRQAGHRYGPAILATSKHQRLPFALALALVEQESSFINQFGCDQGPQSTVPWCHQLVTRDRVQALIRHVKGGGISNGVGLTQLTSIGLILEAEAEGGAHRVRPQLRVGFRLLHDLIEQDGEVDGIGCYNGGPGNPVAKYSKEVRDLRDIWQTKINHALLG